MSRSDERPSHVHERRGVEPAGGLQEHCAHGQHGHPGAHAHGAHDAQSEHNHGSMPDEAPDSLKDPVCGMSVSKDSKFRAEHEGTSNYFCSESCQKKFVADPGRYVSPPADVAAAAAPEGTIYTCPMHPEIRQDRPGNCPKCGMALEPLMPGLDDEENPELEDFRHRFWWTLPLTAVVFILAMFGHRLGLMEASTQSWVELVLSTPVVLWAGLPFFKRCVQSFINRSVREHEIRWMREHGN